MSQAVICTDQVFIFTASLQFFITLTRKLYIGPTEPLKGLWLKAFRQTMPETDKDEPLQQRPGPSDAPTSEYTFVARVPPSVNPERPPVFEEAMDLHSLSWRSVSVTIMDRSSKKPKLIVDNANGIINAGKRHIFDGVALV